MPKGSGGVQRLLIACGLVALGLATVGLSPASSATDIPPEEAPAEPLDGVVLEELASGSALEKAELQPGDLLLSWERLPNPPIHTTREQGAIRSVFDWLWLETEQAPRGPMRLAGRRGGEARVFEVPVGPWEAEVRPPLQDRFLELYQEGRRRVEAGQVVEGTALWRAAAAAQEARRDRWLQAWWALRTGEAWAEHRQWEAAREAYRSGLEQAPSPMVELTFLRAIGHAYDRQFLLEEAKSSYTAALDLAQATWGRSLMTAQGLGALATIFGELGYLEEAETLLKGSLQILEDLAPDSLQTGKILHNLGIMASARNDYEAASEWVQRSLEIKERWAPSSYSTSHTLDLLGSLAHVIGDLEASLDYFHRALELRRKTAPGSIGEALSLHNLGSVAYARGDLETASDYFRQALQLSKTLDPAGLPTASNLSALGHVDRARGRLQEAREKFEGALEIVERISPQGLPASDSLREIGIIAREMGDLDAAEHHLIRALELQQRLAPNSIEAAEILHALGRVQRDRSHPELALGFLERALEALEAQIRKLGASPHDQARYRADYIPWYRDAIAINLALDRPVEAFDLTERSRASSFLLMLRERDLMFSSELPRELRDARQALGRKGDRILAEMAALDASEGAGKLEALQAELRAVDREVEQLRVRARKTAPRLATLEDPHPLTLAQARGILDPGTVMLSYSVGETQTHLFVVSSEHPLEVHTLPAGRQELAEKVEHLAGLARWRRLTDFHHQTSAWLYRTLVGPAADALDASQRVLIVPDGPLHRLAFAALIRERGEEGGKTARGWRYLIEDRPLHTVLSATVYAELKATRSGAGPELEAKPVSIAAFGDPSYPRKLTQAEPDGIPEVRLRSALRRGFFDFEPLPYSRHEVEAIASLYPPERVQTFLGAAATEERVKAMGEGVKILHFATHATIDDRLPLSSALVLSIPEDLSEGRNNGLLQVWEILEQVRLEADLVVLSACGTALGQELSGEGLIGLTRAFQYAGARSVLASLWQVPDDTTAELMQRFHAHLAAGLPKDEALQRSQIELIRGPLRVDRADGRESEIDASAPYFWAAFQLVGDWR